MKIDELKIWKPDAKDTMGIKRKDMPQVASSDYGDFMDYLKSLGAKFSRAEDIDPSELKPTQGEFSDAGVERQLRKVIDGGPKKDIIISGDNYVIDGHHRWIVAKNTGAKVNVLKIDIPAKKLLDIVRKFDKTSYKDIYTEKSSQALGIPKGATLAQLDKIASTATGAKRERAHYLRNMRRGKQKNEKLIVPDPKLPNLKQLAKPSKHDRMKPTATKDKKVDEWAPLIPVVAAVGRALVKKGIKVGANVIKGWVRNAPPGASPDQIAAAMTAGGKAAVTVKDKVSKTNEGYMLQLERDKRANMLVLHIKDTKTGRRSEVRGKMGYETDGYDPEDKLHKLLDKVGRSASVSDMMNGDVVHINPNHPQGPEAQKAAHDITSEHGLVPMYSTMKAYGMKRKTTNGKKHFTTEKITKDTPMGDVIKDFYKSDAPQFKGKSKKKRREMAIAAKLSQESVMEEIAKDTSIISPDVKRMGKIFARSGYEIRIVGGAVRDVALGKDPKDIDLATDATPNEMIEMFKKEGIRHVPSGIEHGTITAVINSEPYEITTLRADVNPDGRHSEVEFVKSWEEDAKRRDLTYNAMSMSLDGEIHDYFGGMDDLQNQVSKFVGDPAERIQEDYLRVLRYFRFQSKLDKPNFSKEALKAIKDNADGLSGVSVERVWQEMSKLLVGPSASEVLTFMGKTGVAKVIGLPVTKAQGVKFDNPIMNLAVLVNDPRIAMAWKMSNEQRKELAFYTQHKKTKLSKEAMEWLLVDGANPEWTANLLRMQGQDSLALKAQSFKSPEFPLTGKDLIDAGMKPGPDMGKTLAKLKVKWKQSGYKLSKEELLGL